MNYSNSQRAGVIFYLTALLFGAYDSEQKEKGQLLQKINCSECDSFQLYQAADGSASLCMGKVSSLPGENAAVLQKFIDIKRWLLYSFMKAFYKRVCFADLLAKAFLKCNQWKKSFVRKCHTSFRCSASGSNRTPGRCGYQPSILLL